MILRSGIRHLYHLAHLYGIQMAYYDVNHHRQQASEESLLAVLRSLGAPVASLQDVPSAWRERQQVLWRRAIEPVIVAWNGESFPVEIRLPLSAADANLKCHLKLESGEELRWKWHGPIRYDHDFRHPTPIAQSVLPFKGEGGSPPGTSRRCTPAS